MQILSIHRSHVLSVLPQVVFKTILGCLRDLERSEDLEEEEDDLDTTDDGESCQKPHGASNQTQLGIEFDLLISLYVVESGRVEEDLDQLKGGLWNHFP